MSYGRLRSDVYQAAYRVGRTCSPARSARPSETGGHLNIPRRSSALQIREPHVCRDASLLQSTSTRLTQTGGHPSAPHRSSALHIRELSVERGADDELTDEEAAFPATAREEYTVPSFGAPTLGLCLAEL